MQASTMLAYIFWHRPFRAYRRRRLRRSRSCAFRAISARQRRPAFAPPHRSGSRRCHGWAITRATRTGICSKVVGHGPAQRALRSRAARRRPHDTVAAQMEEGQGGLYAHAGGETSPAAQSSVFWLTRPRGISWQAALEPLRARHPRANRLAAANGAGPGQQSLRSRCRATPRSKYRPAGRLCACGAFVSAK